MLSWNEIVQKYIVKHSNAIRRTTRPLHDHFGVGYFTYHRIDMEGKYTVLVDSPEWAEHYVGREFYKQDPNLRHPDGFQSGITCYDAHGDEQFFSDVLCAAKKVLKVDEGVQIVQKSETGVEIFGFCGKSQKGEFQTRFFNNSNLLMAFTHYFKGELGAILHNMQSEVGPLHELKGDDYFVVQTPAATLDVPAFLQAVGMKNLVTIASLLTSREKECLHYLLNGKSAKETAALLAISSRTIETHFENIKRKLKSYDKPQVFAIAKELQRLQLLQ